MAINSWELSECESNKLKMMQWNMATCVDLHASVYMCACMYKWMEMCVCICHSLQTNEAMTNYPSESVNVNEGKCRFRLLHATLVQLSRQKHPLCACLYVCACVHINKIFETCTHILFYCKLQQLNSSSNSFYCIQFDYIIIFITFITYTHTHMHAKVQYLIYR